jgi:hypothetical protein
LSIATNQVSRPKDDTYVTNHLSIGNPVVHSSHSVIEGIVCRNNMVWSWLTHLALRLTTHKQTRYLMSVSSRYDTTTVLPSSEAEEMLPGTPPWQADFPMYDSNAASRLLTESSSV